jgi:protein-disulfide isomerase
MIEGIMLTSRRNLLAVVAGATLAQSFGSPIAVRADDLTRAERSIGKPDAKTTVSEYFSLTCSHCAAFAATTMPKVKSDLIATGKVRWVFNDYPLDQIALMAAQIARYLPVDRYEPFINALLGTQDRWAFARDANHTEELWKTAGLAGMGRATFDKAVADDDLKKWILQQQQADQEKWKIDSTPSFVINGTKYAGEMTFSALRELIPDV